MKSDNHAFLILAHNNPSHVVRIVKSLESRNHFFFIHIDKKSKDDFETPLKNFENCIFIKNRINCNWGGFSLVNATLELLKTSFDYCEFSHFHLISGADYFCTTNEKFDNFFRNNDNSYLDIITGPDFEWRLKIFVFNDYINKRGKLGKFFLRLNYLQKRISRYIPLRKNIGQTFYYGSQWFSLHRNAVEFILNYCKTNPWYIQRFHFTYVPDESFFHMIIMNSPLAHSVVKNNLRFLDWKPKKETDTLPRVLDVEDYDDIIKKGSFFCRKISYGISDALMDKFDKLREQAYGN